MINHFYELRHCEMEPAVTFQLAPFIMANRPYDLGPDQTWQAMRAQGFEAIDHVSTGMEEITEDVTVTGSITFDHSNPDVAFVTREDVQGNWIQSKINHWKAQTAAKTPTQ